MAKHILIEITAEIPNEELGHEAVVATKAPVQAVVDVLETMGVKVDAKRRLVTRREEPNKPKPKVTLAAAE